MTYNGIDMRVDWAMRQYVDQVVGYLSKGGDQANARMNMTERGVPLPVQHRVLEGKVAVH